MHKIIKKCLLIVVLLAMYKKLFVILDSIIVRKLKMISKYQETCEILDKWLSIKEDKIEIESYFLNKNITKIGIYGNGMLGKHLKRALEGTSVEVVCYFDQNAHNFIEDVPVYAGDSTSAEVEGVVVCVIGAFENIKNLLGKNYKCPIVSINDVIFETIKY